MKIPNRNTNADPPKRARRLGGRSFQFTLRHSPKGSGITTDGRRACHCAGSLAACIHSCDRSSEDLISNRHSCRLELDVTPCKQTTAGISNRLKSGIFLCAVCASFCLRRCLLRWSSPPRSWFGGAPAMRYPPRLAGRDGFAGVVLQGRIHKNIHKNNEGEF